MRRGADPTKPFYIIGDAYLDGSIDIEGKGHAPIANCNTALDEAAIDVAKFGGQQFVIECRVVACIGAVEVDPLPIRKRRRRHG